MGLKTFIEKTKKTGIHYGEDRKRIKTKKTCFGMLFCNVLTGFYKY
jgi:hypothetical protein